jgi:hypothetical protein
MALQGRRRAGPPAAGPSIERRYFLLRPKSDLAASAALSIASFTDDLAWSALPSLLRPLSSVTDPPATSSLVNLDVT